MMRFIIGSLFALPNELLFFAVWILASLIRPLLVLTLVCALSNPGAAYRKLQLLVISLQFLILCNDKKWKEAEDPANFFKKKEDAKITRKTVIFVRHGESSWNDTFNKGDRGKFKFILYFIPNMIYAIVVEWYFFVSGKANESWFYDSPLSEKGKRQAQSVQEFLKTDPAFLTPKEMHLLKILKGGDDNGDENSKGVDNNDTEDDPAPPENQPSSCSSSQLVSSNLRRAIATMAIGFEDRLFQNFKDDTILILPCLQEISRNPDALAITPAYGKIVPAWTDPKIVSDIYEQHVDTRLHFGNKPVNTNGLQRLNEFCKIAFEDISKPNLIVGGHSLWFRSFFRTFLPRSSNHVAKTKKLVNGGLVGFTLERLEVSANEYHYMIDPTSIVTLHGGF
jgi:hypothetical protein